MERKNLSTDRSTARVDQAKPILLVTRNFPPDVGGTCTLTANLYAQFPKGKVVVLTALHVEAPSFDAAYPHPIFRRDFHCRDRLKPFEWLELGLRQLTNVGACKRRYGLAELHCGSVIPEAVTGLAAKWLYGRPFIVWVHGEDVATFQQYRVEGLLQRLIFRGADRVVANSDNTARICLELGVSAEKVRVVRPGVDLTAFKPDPSAGEAIRVRHGLVGRKILTTIGRLQRRKGHDHLLQALPRIRAAIPNVAYLIVGGSMGAPPEDAALFRRLSKELRLEDVVHFVGVAPAAEVPAYYAAADLFVMPNRAINGDIEGFGQSFLEAAACGKTSIAGNSGGAVEAVIDGETGLVVDGENPLAIADAAIRLLTDDGLRERLAANALLRTAEFSWPEVYQRFVKALG